MRKILMTAAVFAMVGCGSNTTSTHDHDAKLLKDRIWIERVPAHDKDRIEVFIALSPKKAGRVGPVGVFEKVSAWEGHFQAYRYESEGQTMKIIFPQTGETETLTVKATKCDQDRMDYCLEVSGNGRGAHRYYSRKGMEIRSLAEAQAKLLEL